jgi:hypothetical protein
VFQNWIERLKSVIRHLGEYFIKWLIKVLLVRSSSRNRMGVIRLCTAYIWLIGWETNLNELESSEDIGWFFSIYPPPLRFHLLDGTRRLLTGHLIKYSPLCLITHSNLSIQF